jgi:type IV pilus assembly protein PilB
VRPGTPPAQGQQVKPSSTPPAPPKPGAAPPAPQKPAAPPAAGAKPAAPLKPAAQQPSSGQAKPVAQQAGSAPAKPAAPPPAKAGATPPAAGKAPPPRPSGKPAVSAAKHKPTPTRPGQSTRTTGRRLGQVLVDLGYIDEVQLEEVLTESQNAGTLIGQAAIARGLITETQLMQALADQFGLRLLNVEELQPSPEALTAVNENMASVYKVLPLSYRDGCLTVVLGDPAVLQSMDDLRNFLGCKEVVPLLSFPSAIADVMSKCYAGKEESMLDFIKSLQSDDDLAAHSGGRETSIDLQDLLEMQNEAPVRKLLNMVMLMAIKDRASDIHFEPFEDEFKMRYRCDGVMYEMVPPPRHLATALSTRIKVMANLDIAERRLPQDGRIELNVGGNAVDMRVSILPTMFGEAAVLRVLDKGNVGLSLDRIGMEPHILNKLREIIRKPNGVFLVTGPTGSGKTTTLYSCLNELNDITEKIITTEDPVEYDLDGIVQVPINSEIGVTFAASLRAILRQDPDKILVGEIRDLETAQIAVQSALTGHMVFSTLHTNDAPSTITRLRDMGIETFLITASVEGIVAQRLVRKICEDCRTEFEPSPEMLMELNLRPVDVAGKKFYFGKGCGRCNNTGHRGRMGLYEMFILNDEIRDLISNNASTDQLRECCIKNGMTTLRDSGLNAIFRGDTTIEQVVQETIMDDE